MAINLAMTAATIVGFFGSFYVFSSWHHHVFMSANVEEWSSGPDYILMRSAAYDSTRLHFRQSVAMTVWSAICLFGPSYFWFEEPGNSSEIVIVLVVIAIPLTLLNTHFYTKWMANTKKWWE